MMFYRRIRFVFYLLVVALCVPLSTTFLNEGSALAEETTAEKIVAYGSVLEAVEEKDESEEPIEETASVSSSSTEETTSKESDEAVTLSTLLRNFLEAVKYKMELLKLQHERDKLLLENELQMEKNRYQLAELTAEKERLLLENELQAAKQTQAVSGLSSEKELLELQNAVKDAKQKQQLVSVESERHRLAVNNALQEEKNKQTELQIQLETSKLVFEAAKLEYEKAKKSLNIEELAEKIAERTIKEEWESQVNKPKEYLEEPYVDGRLILSDRQVYLDGPIFVGTSDYINERIQYFNNKDSRYPIFFIIDRCEGGSVMEGAKIIKAMETSRAPVYVVVKSLAASMAATIAALAKRSYAYPNALIVHHQMWSYSIGNQIQQEEQLQITKEWSRRLMQPVAEKMGITTDDFVKQMYENNSEGNWLEFADNAVRLKWLDTVVDDIKDTSYIKQPKNGEDEEGTTSLVPSGKEKIDERGQHYVELPRLAPLDFYYLYNPNNYYRVK